MIDGLALARPWVLAGLALLPLYALGRWRRARRRRVPFAPLQYRQPGPRRHLERLLLPAELALLALLLLGLAGPYTTERVDLFEDEGIDLALVLDVSLSMLATDFEPTRMGALKRIARDFIHVRGSDRIALVIFARDAYVQTPLTTDQATLLTLLESVTPHAIDQRRSGGTAIGDALLLAADLLVRGRREGRDQALVLITDGESNLGLEPELAARWVGEREIRLYAVGVGGDEPAEAYFEGHRVGGDNVLMTALDDEQLQAVARRSGGRYYRAKDAGALERIFAELARLESRPLESVALDRRRYAGDRLGLVALFLFGAYVAVRDGALRRPLR